MGDVGTVSVPLYWCSKCFSPLQLDPSLTEHLDLEAYRQVADPMTRNPPALQQAPVPSHSAHGSFVDVTDAVSVSKQTVSDSQVPRGQVKAPQVKPSVIKAIFEDPDRGGAAKDVSADDYVMVRTDEQAAKAALDNRVVVATQLFDLVSSNALLDHPLCGNCANLLLQTVKKRRSELESEQEAYKTFLDSITNPITSTEEAELEEEIRQLLLEDHELVEQLDALRKEEETIMEDEAAVKKAFDSLGEQERRYLSQLNVFHFKQESFLAERDRIIQQHKHVAEKVNRLRQTNVYNDVFHISAEGHFATINGLRLGRLPTCQVDWNEINAALGHCVLLLDVLATRLKYKYKKYNLIPFGSTSKVEIIADKSILELYGPVEFVRVMRKTRFNKALVGILTCLSELCQELYSRFGDASIPYKIQEDRIGENSITNVKDEAAWTRALKHFMINLKWCLQQSCRPPPPITA